MIFQKDRKHHFNLFKKIKTTVTKSKKINKKITKILSIFLKDRNDTFNLFKKIEMILSIFLKMRKAKKNKSKDHKDTLDLFERS